MALSKFVDSSFRQCNVHTGVKGGCLAFTPLDGYLLLWELHLYMTYYIVVHFALLRRSITVLRSTISWCILGMTQTCSMVSDLDLFFIYFLSSARPYTGFITLPHTWDHLQHDTVGATWDCLWHVKYAS